MTQEVDIKPPSHIVTDWSFFLQLFDGKKFEIGSYFDKENWKINMVLHMRISHIYDLSHFWVVCKERELDAFHKYLHDFYSKYKAHYKIPMQNLKSNMYCIVYTEGAFYRSILVNIPLAIEDVSWAFVFLIDFGFMAKVSLEEFYFMSRKMYDVPQFAIRAALSGLGPVETTVWSSDAVSKFNELVCNKVLPCQVTNRNYATKVLYLKIGEYNRQTKSLDTINDILVMERVAKQMSLVDIKEMKKRHSKRNKTIRLPFLSPSFDEIEKGACVDSVAHARYLDEFNKR